MFIEPAPKVGEPGSDASDSELCKKSVAVGGVIVVMDGIVEAGVMVEALGKLILL